MLFRKYIPIIILGLVLFSHQPMSAHDRVVRLDDGWRCQSSAVTGGMWYEASVPSTVMGVLTSQSDEYPDILEGMNYKRVDSLLQPLAEDSRRWVVNQIEGEDHE